MARLLRVTPAIPEAGALRAVMAQHLTEANLAQELAYAKAPGRESFERPYGWAWMFKLCEELAQGNAPEWHARVEPLAKLFAMRLIAWLPRQRYPIRVGVHSNTAFALGFALDYARASGHHELESAVTTAARRFYGNDRAAPAVWEPNGNDFLSPSLVEADLMARVLAPDAFNAWFAAWLPELATGHASNLLDPVEATDRSDGQGVHLDGLNLSRAWCLRRIANIRKDAALHTAADRHLEAGLAQVQSGDFLGEHWLATFALHALSA